MSFTSTHMHGRPRGLGRRRTLGLLGLSGAALVAGLPAGRARAQSAPDVVNVAFFLNTHPSMVAKARGWFEEGVGAKLNWSEAGSGAEINTAMVASAVDIALGIGSSPSASGISQGIGYKIVGIADNIGPAEDLVVRRSAGIASPADLRGKKVATPFGSTSHFRLLGLLATTGLSERDVTVLDLKPDAAVAAWTRGDIDAAYLWNPAKSRMLDADGQLLATAATLDEKGYVIADLVVARSDFAEEYPDAVTGFLKALGRAFDAFATSPDEVVPIVAAEVGATPETVKRDIVEYQFLSLKDQLGPEWLGTPGQPGRFAGVLKRTADFLVDQRSIREAAEEADFGEAIDTSFLEKALAA